MVLCAFARIHKRVLDRDDYLLGKLRKSDTHFHVVPLFLGGGGEGGSPGEAPDAGSNGSGGEGSGAGGGAAGANGAAIRRTNNSISVSINNSGSINGATNATTVQ